MGIQSKMKQWTRTESKGDFSQTIFFLWIMKMYLLRIMKKSNEQKLEKKVKANDELRTIFFLLAKFRGEVQKKKE